MNYQIYNTSKPMRYSQKVKKIFKTKSCKKEEILKNSCYEFNITLIIKPNKNIHSKKTYNSISLIDRDAKY